MIERVEPPWTPGQVESLNGFQSAGIMHPFTCVNQASHGERSTGVLIAVKSGWLCPNCDYTQYWAHAFMADGAWRAWGRDTERSLTPGAP